MPHMWTPSSKQTPPPDQVVDGRSVVSYRWHPYSPRSEQYKKRGIKGRWQVSDGFGWRNADGPPEEWRIPVPSGDTP